MVRNAKLPIRKIRNRQNKIQNCIQTNRWVIWQINKDKKSTAGDAAKTGITFGSALAMVISYSTWKSVGWAIIHGLMSWVYVIYYVIRY